MSDLGLPDAESLRLELQEAIASFRHQNVLLTQSFGIFVTANTLLLAYGFAQRKSGILFLASLLPLGLLFLAIELTTSLVPVTYVATRLEESLSLHEVPLVTTFIGTRHGILFSLLSSIEDSYDPKTHSFAKKMSSRLFLKNRQSRWLLWAFVVQLCLFIVSLTVYHYRLM